MRPFSRVSAVLLVLFISAAVAQGAGARSRAARADGTLAASDFVRGTITAVSGNQIEVARTIRIDVSAAYIVSGDTMELLTPAALRPGVEVIAVVRRDATTNTLRADAVVVSNPDAVTLSGAVEAIDPARQTLRVLGVDISVTPATLFVPLNMRLSDLPIGSQIIVMAALEGNQLVARRVVAVASMHQPGAGAAVTFTGRVESIVSGPGGGLWKIGGRDVVVTPFTTITGNPVVGDSVRVTGRDMHGTPGAGQQVLAEKIEKL